MTRAALLLLLAGCATATGGPESSPAPSGVQAALALVSVENRTPHRLTISFTTAAQRGVVTIGTVPSDSTRRLAPVPATEPILLRAQRPDGAGLTLAARTFRIDEEWLWVIPADARFE